MGRAGKRGLAARCGGCGAAAHCPRGLCHIGPRYAASRCMIIASCINADHPELGGRGRHTMSGWLHLHMLALLPV